MNPQAPTTEDAADIAALDAACFGGGAWNAASVRAELTRAGACGRWVPGQAYALGWALAGEAELVRIGVTPDQRGKGVGGAVLAAFLDQTRGSGAQATWLEVRADNGPALAIYRRAGFVTTGRRRGYYPDGCDAVVMAHNAETQP